MVRWIFAAVAAAIAIAAVVAIIWLRRRRVAPRRRVRREARTRYPVVLAHGLMGFDEVRIGLRRYAYFRGVPERLAELGVQVETLRVAKAASVAVRGRQFGERLRALEARRVNVVAHSMGGVDARYAIAKEGVADRVASLTTIGTPHRGTPLADVGAQVLGESVGVPKMLRAVGIDVGALFELTPSRMAAFNREVPDAPDVAYASFIAAVRDGATRLNALLIPGYLFLRQRFGPNDGLVPADSQKWGEVLGEVEADHWAQIGWSRRFDAASFYEGLVRELRGRGF